MRSKRTMGRFLSERRTEVRPSRWRERAGEWDEKVEGESPYRGMTRWFGVGWRGVGMIESEKCDEVSGE